MGQIDYKKFWSPAFDTMDEFVYLLDKEFNIIRANKAIIKSKGKSESYLIGKKCYEVIHGKNEPVKDCPHKKMLESKKFEMAELFAPSQQKWFYVRTTPLFCDKKQLVGAIHLSTDVSKQKNVVNALKESEEKFRTLAEQSPNMIFINKNGRVVYANKESEKIMGYKKKEFYSDNFDYMSTISPEFRDNVKKAFSVHMRGTDVPSYEYKLVTKKGQKLDVILASKLINYEGGKAILGIVTDITGRKQVEHMKDKFICDISHGLKTPVAVIEMALEVCKEAMKCNNTAQIQKAHSMVYNNVKKIHKDVDNLLEIFKLETIKEEREKVKVSLKSIINEVLEGLSYIVEQKNIKININIPKYANSIIIEKRDAFILLNNILDNAIKFTDKGSITVKSKMMGAGVELTVKDTGCGIDKKDIHRVFEKFYKRHPAIDGSGLGLTICKEIVDIYKGKIMIESKGKGHGAAVTVIFPAQKK